MPTGYTAGIIDGKTETFQEFAKQCMRAFGACILRDENMDKEYEPRVPSDYHTKALDIAYHLKEHKEELKRCAESNAWVETLLGSLACV